MDYENNYNDTENVGITEKSTEVDAFSEADQTTSGTDTSDEQVVYFDPEISYSASSTYNFEVDNAKAAKACSTRLHLSIFLYLIISQGIGSVIATLSLLLAPGEALIEGYSAFSVVLNIVAQYVIAFPVFFIMTRNMRKRADIKERKLGADEFFILILISEAAMLLGALISNSIGSFFGYVLGSTPENSVDALVSGGELVLTSLMACVFAPIFEELMFRKLFIDRMSVFGDRAAIILSALGFGFFHGNIYQIIYATAVGLIFGYVYTSTRKIHYTIILHSILNFLGGVMPMLLAPLEQEIYTADKFFETNGYYLDEGAYIINNVILSAFSIFEILMLLGGIAAFIVVLVRKKIKIQNEKEIWVSGKELRRATVLNVGFIAAYALCLGLTILTLFVV